MSFGICDCNWWVNICCKVVLRLHSRLIFETRGAVALRYFLSEGSTIAVSNIQQMVCRTRKSFSIETLFDEFRQRLLVMSLKIDKIITLIAFFSIPPWKFFCLCEDQKNSIRSLSYREICQSITWRNNGIIQARKHWKVLVKNPKSVININIFGILANRIRM